MCQWVLWLCLLKGVLNQKQTEQTLTNFVRKLYCQRNHKPGLTKQPPETSRKKAEKEMTAQGLLQMCSGRIMQKRAPPRVSGLRAARCTEHETSSFLRPCSGPTGFNVVLQSNGWEYYHSLLSQTGVFTTIIILLLHWGILGEMGLENYGSQRNSILTS